MRQMKEEPLFYIEKINEKYMLIHRELEDDSLYEISSEKEIYHAKKIEPNRHTDQILLFIEEDLGYGHVLQYYMNLKGQIVSFIFNTFNHKYTTTLGEEEKLKQEIQNFYQTTKEERLLLKQSIAWKGQTE